MTHYAQYEGSVRVDFFRESGEFFCTEAVLWAGGYDGVLTDTFRETLVKHLNGRLRGMTAVCIHPYHSLPRPLMMEVPADRA